MMIQTKQMMNMEKDLVMMVISNTNKTDDETELGDEDEYGKKVCWLVLEKNSPHIFLFVSKSVISGISNSVEQSTNDMVGKMSVMMMGKILVMMRKMMAMARKMLVMMGSDDEEDVSDIGEEKKKPSGGELAPYWIPTASWYNDII